MARAAFAFNVLAFSSTHVLCENDAVLSALEADAEVCASEECEGTHWLQHSAKQRRRGAEAGSTTTATTLAPELVSAVYTYGAPATHKEPFRNAARADECFPGLRIYTENLKGTKDHIHQVDAAAMNNFYPHAWTDTLTLHEGRDSYFSRCYDHKEFGHPEWPQRGTSVYEEWRIHHEEQYDGRMKTLTLDGKDVAGDEPFKTAGMFVRLAFLAYEPLEKQARLLKEDLPDWTIVARTDDKHGDDVDPVTIVQNKKTLDCALAFTGTNSFGEIFTSTTNYGAKYCGYTGVHVGYKNELWTLSKRVFPNLKPALEKCRKVACVGHSLGGALCELFAACANSGNTTDPDYQLLAWTPALASVRMKEAVTVDPPVK